MTVEYRANLVTNMDIAESKSDFKEFWMDGSNLHCTVHAWRNSPYRVATVCLGLLCVLLLAVVIGQSVHYRKVDQDHRINLQDTNKEIENLQENLKTVRKDKQHFQDKRDELQQKYDFLSKKKDQIQTNNNLLTSETNKLKLSQSQLQTTNADLNKDIEQLRAKKNQLDTNNMALSTAKDMLQKLYDGVVKQKKELQGIYNLVTKERDNLQNTVNNVTRSKGDLQMSFNDLIRDVEHLQERYNSSNSEKDKLSSTHQNLTLEKDTLQDIYKTLKKSADMLQVSYVSLVQEKKELESSCKNVTAERELLKVKIINLTAERDYFQGEVDQLNLTIHDKKCPTDWQKFQYSCYYTSVGKKNWKKSREYCQSKGADLATIKSQSEMTFINGLYDHDKEVWIGLADEGVEGNWKWVDGSPLTVTFWAKGQPNSYNGRDQDCVEFWHRASGQGEWNDENCNLDQNWICKM